MGPARGVAGSVLRVPGRRSRSCCVLQALLDWQGMDD